MRINNSFAKHSNVVPPQNLTNSIKNDVAFKGMYSNAAISMAGNGNAAANVFAKGGKAFSKGYDKLTDTIAKGMGKLSNTNVIKNIATKVGNNKKGFLHLMVAESVILAGFYMYNTAKNDKIDKKQKPQMLINEALVCAFSAFCTYKLDGKISKATKSLQKVFEDTNKTLQKTDPKKFTNIFDGIDKLKSVVIFGIIYRYLGPVLFTPVANKLSAMLQNRKDKKEAETTPAEQNTPPAAQQTANTLQPPLTTFKAFKQ